LAETVGYGTGEDWGGQDGGEWEDVWDLHDVCVLESSVLGVEGLGVEELGVEELGVEGLGGV
jgi:hypothetical protein